MSCADVCIDMGMDDCENEFYVESFITARKPHRCCECHGEVSAGDSYQRAAAKSDGRIWTKVTCRRCAEIRKALVCGGWIFGELWQCIEDGVFPQWAISSPIDCLAKIESKQARDFISRRFDDWRGRA